MNITFKKKKKINICLLVIFITYFIIQLLNFLSITILISFFYFKFTFTITQYKEVSIINNIQQIPLNELNSFHLKLQAVWFNETKFNYFYIQIIKNHLKIKWNFQC